MALLKRSEGGHAGKLWVTDSTTARTVKVTDIPVTLGPNAAVFL